MTTNHELKHAADMFDQMTNDFLIHYGTPGMHWRQQGPGKRWQSQAVYAQGRPNPDAKVRGQKEDTPAPTINAKSLNKLAKKGKRDQVLTKDHVVPAGTTIYRGVKRSDEPLSGSKYVTYLDGDRDSYRALRSGYEYQYKLNKDIKVAGRDKFIDAIDKATTSDEAKKDVAKGWAEAAIPPNSIQRMMLMYDHETGGLSEKKWDDYVSGLTDNFMKAPLERRWFMTAQSLGTTPKVKDAVIDILRKQGYDACIDEAAVGGKNSWPRECIAPMIIFNSSECMSQASVKKTPGNFNKYAKDYRKRVTKYNKTSGEWSDSNDKYSTHSKLTVNEAYDNVSGFLNERPIVNLCFESINYFGFYLSPSQTNKKSMLVPGRNILFVNKNDGDVFYEVNAGIVFDFGEKDWKAVSNFNPTGTDHLQHTVEVFDQLTDDFLMHYGTPGMHWRQQGPGKRWQSQAVYAQGKPNPDAKVRGNKVDSDTKKRMSTMNDLDFILSDSSNIPVYPKQKLSDLKRLNKPVDKSVRYEINHPSFEKDADGYPNYDGRHCNCPNCAMAFEMTERGYDVIARPAEDGSNVGDIERFFQNKQLQSMGPTAGDLKKASKLYEEYSNADKKYFDAYHAWKNGNIFSRPRLEKEKDAARRERDKAYDKYDDEADSIVNKVVDNTNKAILSQGPSARGIIVVGWADSDDITGPFRTTAYHAFNYKNENGKVKFYDVQSGRGNNLTGFTIDEAKDGFFQDVDPRDVFIMRTDNAKVTERTMDAVYSPNRSRDLKHAAEDFDQLTDDFLMHYGTPGMHWRQQGPGKRYQSQAVYAQGKPNPDAKVRGSKEQTNKRVYVLTRKEYDELPAKERLEMRVNAAKGENYKLNKMITDSLRKEKDGTHGRIHLSMLHAGSTTPAELRYEIDNGKVIFREQAFNRKVSQKYADKILNRCLWGRYTKEKEFPKAALYNLRKKKEANNKREDGAGNSTFNLLFTNDGIYYEPIRR